MSEKFTNPAEFFNSEPEQEPEQPQKLEISTISEPIKFDSGKKEVIILAREGQEEKRHPFQEVLYRLRNEGVPASTGEWLDLQTLLDAGEVQNLDELYIVSRAVLVKDVTDYPKFDNVFGEMFYGLEPPNPDEEEEDDYYEDEYYDEEQDSSEEDQEGEESEALEEDGSEETNKEQDAEEKSDEDSEQKEIKQSENIEQKDKEDIDEVAESTTETSEDVHGGKEATKDIEDSPNPADEGKDKDNKGAKKGVEGKEGEGKEGEGGENKSKKGEIGEGGDKKNGMGSESKEDLEETDEQGKGKKKPGSGGKGKRKKKSKIKRMSTGGEGGYASAKERIMERKYDELGEDRSLSYEHFGRALSKLRGIIQETTSTRTRTLDAKATVRSISEHAGAPELLWKEEVEEKPNVVLMFDVGGSTDEFRPILEQLFTAAKDELQGLEIYYFHNAIYGEVWPQKDGNWGKNFVPVGEIMKRDPSTKVIIVGDAWMADSDWMNGGLHDSYEELNERSDADNRYHRMSGQENFAAIVDNFPSTVWINPILEKNHEEWDNSGTIEDVKQLLPMYDLTLHGLEDAVKKLMENH
jgi:uncharacterized protein with von Willebrand factor type A (vWA) domain